MSSRSRSVSEASVEEFSKENADLLSRILAHGGTEARGYALAVIANGATVEDIDEIQAKLDEIRRDIQ